MRVKCNKSRRARQHKRHGFAHRQVSESQEPAQRADRLDRFVVRFYVVNTSQHLSQLMKTPDMRISTTRSRASFKDEIRRGFGVSFTSMGGSIG